MATERDDSLQSINVRLNKSNYTYWAYVMKNFLIGKDMWGYVSGNIVIPNSKTKVEEYDKLLATWERCNAKIITWINNSVDLSIDMHLDKFSTAKEVWDHLATLFFQSNFAKRYQLESDIREAKQGDRDVQEFYSIMNGYWDQLALTEPADLKTVAPYVKYREEQRLVQFLMALRHDFEALRGQILHRNPLPSLDSVVNELLAEEVRLKSQAGSKGILPLPTESVLTVPSKPYFNYHNKPQRTASDECNFCKKKGHWKAQCPQILKKQQQGTFHKQYHTAAAATPRNEEQSSQSLIERLQKLLVSQQSHSLNPMTSSFTASAVEESDWDMP
ncbi:uncharacterized protein LOC113302209 isoform X2 [Papaver somniferum]|uniref:uncharacterized protein LOC113302209 isoform X2 n=1 Tax=Papaver somniferum TaxID=3469 RepID=UPI000E7002EF|nr:uncharacterized protein LOC113302209 isoform X2 [Papaver somniferum]